MIDFGNNEFYFEVQDFVPIMNDLFVEEGILFFGLRVSGFEVSDFRTFGLRASGLRGFDALGFGVLWFRAESWFVRLRAAIQATSLPMNPQ